MMMRRRGLIAGAALLVAGGVALGWKKIFARHYPPTPYDDVLARLDDREWAARFGATVRMAMPGFAPAAGAARLRTLLGQEGLAPAAARDLAAGRVVEAGGWIVPECVALIAALAASQA